MGLLDDETRWPSHRAVVLVEVAPATVQAQVQARGSQTLEAWRVKTAKLGWKGRANMAADRPVEMKRMRV